MLQVRTCTIQWEDRLQVSNRGDNVDDGMYGDVGDDT